MSLYARPKLSMDLPKYLMSIRANSMLAYIDANGNAKYDTGKLLENIQPEEVFYFNKKIKVKQNWDIEQSWDIYALPIDQQKPLEIKKNKPKLKRGERERNTSDEEEEEDYFDDGFGSGNGFGGGRNGNQNNRGFGGGGFKSNSGNQFFR